MNPILRELLNGLFVLVVASLMSTAFAAFQLSFNLQLWVWIVLGVGITVGFYVVFEVALGMMTSAEAREAEWLKRAGTPARLALNQGEVAAGMVALGEAAKAIRAGSDYTVMIVLIQRAASNHLH
jgi:hypothetical protein